MKGREAVGNVHIGDREKIQDSKVLKNTLLLLIEASEHSLRLALISQTLLEKLFDASRENLM